MNPVYKPLVYQQIPSNYSNFALKQDFASNNNKSILISSNRLQHINCIIEPTNQQGGVFLGDIVCLLKTQLLDLHKIRSILTCMIEPISKPNHNSIQNHKIVFIKDNLEYPILNHFKQTYQFINKMRKQKKNVLVHCHAGVSRSATILCAYLIQKNQWNPNFALNYIRSKRERAKPNINFFKQLQNFYNEIIASKKLVLNSKKNQDNSKKNFNFTNSQINQKFHKINKQFTVNNIIEQKNQINQNKDKDKDLKNKKQFIVLEQQIQCHSELLDLQEKQKRLSKIGKIKARIPFEKGNQNKQLNLFKQDLYQTKDFYTNRSQLFNKKSQIPKYQNRISLSTQNMQGFGKPYISINSVSSFDQMKPKQNKFTQYYQMGSYNVDNKNYKKQVTVQKSHDNNRIKITNQYQTPQKQKRLNVQYSYEVDQQYRRRWSQKLPIYQYQRN